MIRIAILLILSISLYLGLTFLIEQNNPHVKYLSSAIPDNPVESHALPSRVIGSFTLDPVGSQKWLLTQTHLTPDSLEAFSNLHEQQNELAFNGETLWLSDLDLAYRVKILSVTDQHMSLSVHPVMAEDSSGFTAFLQWDNNGGVWYSHYNHLQDGKKQLYRARYVRAQAEQ